MSPFKRGEGGGFRPISCYKDIFFWQNIEKINHLYLFYYSNFSVLSPIVWVQVLENIYKKREKSWMFVFLSPKLVEGGGGQNLGDMSPKKSIFLMPYLK